MDPRADVAGEVGCGGPRDAEASPRPQEAGDARRHDRSASDAKENVPPRPREETWSVAPPHAPEPEGHGAHELPSAGKSTLVYPFDDDMSPSLTLHKPAPNSHLALANKIKNKKKRFILWDDFESIAYAHDGPILVHQFLSPFVYQRRSRCLDADVPSLHL